MTRIALLFFAFPTEFRRPLLQPQKIGRAVPVGGDKMPTVGGELHVVNLRSPVPTVE
jgi:hypothetical protein